EEDGIRDRNVTGVQTCALPIWQPDALTARLTLAAALVAKQDWAAARVELEHVLSVQPDLGQAHYSLGVVRYARGDLDGAIEEFQIGRASCRGRVWSSRGGGRGT